MTELRHREQIESWLGRPLLDHEIDPADTLSNLNESQLEVARYLANNSTLVCLLYLRAVVPVVLTNEVRAFIEDVLQAPVQAPDKQE